MSTAPASRSAWPTARIALVTATAALTAVTATACSTSSSHTTDTAATGSASGSGRTIQVVAAENFWGSIASQLGGSHVKVTSIINNPDADPHDYEPTAADARTVAGAQYTIVNGIGYDAWADKLLAANPGSGRTQLKIGDMVGIKPGGNPHRWYSPDNVHQVIEKITADYKKIDPADAAYFDQQKTTFETKTLAGYNKLIADIKAKYAGTPIGASESIVTPLAEGLGLKMLTPETFLDAMSEGSDPTAKDKATIDQQIKNKQIKIYVYNSQNSTPDVQAQVKEAKAQGIPVATVTETLTPAGATFQQWQTTQLQGIEQALAKATGK
ncbi:metal ABC transporter solute-binding protein, Zn/Mn family [Streptomyces camelliae]|uniref:Zinc ABC transporter substrate-binding protein n=1 Tax=Streptomyces camelliae TaxID=3004093 RepID=A0ABY7NYP7_9ACTN|nr:zinc ABC transporter substrate-binding protein [Streptomyces sp. HUAS 2-6]WBO62894.1 zinc ABC transporter substrate-binding protein [Streptomyces sp. HUAS 2-6]